MKPSLLVRGFTLIELLAVTGIIVVISSLVLSNYNGFGGEVLLENLAYDIALSVRQAQEYGISTQSFGGNFNYAYGMHFATNSGNAQSIYVLFADVDGNGLYDSSGGETVQSTTVAQGYSISALCATAAGSSTCTPATTLDVTFQRPEPDAYIRIPGVAGIFESATITVTAPRGATKNILVYANGEISVQ
jgi:prepilin-type N-terminal cleavage/methylation domain-containing protein